MKSKAKVDVISQIKYGAIFSYILVFFNTITGIFVTPLILGRIGTSQFAIYSLVIILVMFFSIDFGINEVIIRYLPEYYVKDESGISTFFSSVYTLYVCLVIILVILFSIFYSNINLIYSNLTTLEIFLLKKYLFYSVPFIVIYTLMLPVNGILIANERFKIIRFSEIVQRFLTVVLMYLSINYSKTIITHLLISNFLPIIFITFLKVLFAIKNKYIYFGKGQFDLLIIKRIVYYAFWILLTLLLQRLIINIGPTLLGKYTDSLQVAEFTVAMSLEGYIWSLTIILNGLFMPMVVRMNNMKDSLEQHESLSVIVGKYQSFVLYLIFLGFILFGSEFIELWLGSSFRNVYWILIFLIMPSLVLLTQQIGINMIDANNLVRLRFYAQLLAFVFEIICSLILIKKIGAIGMAISIFVGNSLYIILLNSILKFKLGLRLFDFFKKVHLIFLIPIINTLILGKVVNILLFNESLTNLIIKILIIVTFYSLNVYFLSLSKAEKINLKKFITL